MNPLPFIISLFRTEKSLCFSSRIIWFVLVLYFWLVVLFNLDFVVRIFGNFNPLPPYTAVEKYTNIPMKGEIMAELESICQTPGIDSLGISWSDHNRIVDIIRPVYDPSYMVFEKFIEQHPELIRLPPGETQGVSHVIEFIDTYDGENDLILIKTDNLLLRRVK